MACRLRQLFRKNAFGRHIVSLNGITASAISALQTNQAALNVVSNNVANLNTPGYARRVVNEQTLAVGGQLLGVDIASVQRVTNQFLQQEQLAAGGTSSQYDTMAQLFTQLNGLLGGPGDNQSLATGLTNVAAAFATASQAPSSSASQTGVINALQRPGIDILQCLQHHLLAAGPDRPAGGQFRRLDQFADPADLPAQQPDQDRQRQLATTPPALLDQRDTALTSLAQMMGIKTTTNADGSVNVSTTDGVNLVATPMPSFAYSGGASNGSYGNITIQDINPQTAT